MKLKIITCCFLFISNGVFAMDYNKFSFELRTMKTYCYAEINGIDIADSHVRMGMISSGYDISNIIENGKNTMSIYFAGIDEDDSKKINKGDYCTLLIKKKTKDSIVNYTSLIGDSLNNLASGKNSPHYNGLEQTGKVNEGYWSENDQIYKVERTFTVSGVREWEWTKGEVISKSEKNRNKIYAKYKSMYEKLKSNNKQQLMDFYHVALNESAINDGSSIESEWNSLGISQMLDDGYVPRLDYIDNYNIVTYANGKLFRLEDEYGNSPIKMEKKNQNTRTLSPYLAYVDGGIIVAL
ncbi:hypothetical protein [Photobacterium damselae]|uniref:hypothetical protein n=1 Tax=Photobacterium damselae TaxID=38293 RepID=UPI0040688B55